MNTPQNIIQAYHQAPWRIQVQLIALFLLALTLFAIVIGFYLNISAEATAAGLEIEDMITQKGKLELNIADFRNSLAQKTTSMEMESRARKMGYAPVDPAKVKYLVVPGYSERRTPVLASGVKKEIITQSIIKPAFTQSMWEWFYEGALHLGRFAGGSQ